MKKSIIMFTSLLLIALFIGTSMNSAIAADIREVIEDECALCASGEGLLGTTSGGGNCETCGEAAEFAVDYMIENIGGYLQQGWYLLKSVDIAILIVMLIGDGFQLSGYELPQFNAEELRIWVQSWLEEFTGQQYFPVVQFLAALIVLPLALLSYIITTICGGGGIVVQSVPSSIPAQQTLPSSTIQTTTILGSTRRTQSI